MMRFRGANDLLGQVSGRIDGHAHVFRADLPMIDGRRYTPDYDAELSTYSALLRQHGLDGALLIQPSFLGTDNTYLLSQLAAARTQPDLTVRGVVMLDPSATSEDIDALSDAGIVGLRLNLVGGAAPDFDIAPWDGLLRKIDNAGWHVELHCEGPFLPPLLKELLRRCATVVVDHLGLPDSSAPLECEGLTAIATAPLDRVFVKVSAPYRVFPLLPANIAAMHCVPIVDRLVDHIGLNRLVWGSDWPWTRFECRHSYSDALEWTG